MSNCLQEFLHNCVIVSTLVVEVVSKVCARTWKAVLLVRLDTSSASKFEEAEVPRALLLPERKILAWRPARNLFLEM